MGFLNHSILLTGLGLKAQFYGKTVLQTIKGIFVVKSLSEFSLRENISQVLNLVSIGNYLLYFTVAKF